MFSVRQIDGKKVWKRLGMITRAKAIGRDQDQAKRIESGELAQELTEKQLTFFELCDWYLKHPGTIRGKKHQEKRYDIKPWNGKTHRSKLPWSIIREGDPERPSWKREANHLKLLCEYKVNGNGKTIGDLKVPEVTLDLLSEWKASLFGKKGRKKKLSDDTIHDKIDALHKMSEKARKHKKIRPETYTNWKDLDGVAKKRPELTDEDIDPKLINADEYDNLVQVARKEERFQHLAPFMVLLHNTGIRPKELTRLKWEHINFEKNEIALPREITKTGKRRWVPMNAYSRMELESIPRHEGCDHVITYKGENLKRGAESFKRSFSSLRDETGVRHGVKIKYFRHTFITTMDASGVNENIRKMITGHSLPGMDANYILMVKDHLHNAMAQFTEYRYGQDKGQPQMVKRIENTPVLLPSPKSANVVHGVKRGVNNSEKFERKNSAIS
jgi:integrase